MDHHADYLTAEEVEHLRENLTMLDVYRARQEGTEERGLRAYYRAALRLELIPATASLEEFLGRLRTEDFNRIMGESLRVMSGATAGGGAPAVPPPPSGGESGPTSSDGTDSPRESSSSSE